MRAAPLVVVAVVLGVLMLAVGSRPPVAAGRPTAAVSPPPSTSAPTTSTPITAPGATTSAPSTTAHHGSSSTSQRHGRAAAATTTTVPHSSVKVVVANGTSVSGGAGYFTEQLQAQGWNMLPAEDASTTANASAVYYAPNEQQPAAIIASSLGLPASTIQPLTSSTPIGTTSGVDVAVVIGPDLGNKVPTSSGS